MAVLHGDCAESVTTGLALGKLQLDYYFVEGVVVAVLRSGTH